MAKPALVSSFLFCLTLLGHASAGGALSCDENLRDRLPKIEPIILRPMPRLKDDETFQYEMKYDGFRGVAYIQPGRCRIVSRSGTTMTRFQSLCESIAKELGVENAILDGEVIAPDASGRPIFERLMLHQGPYRYIGFDLLWFNGEDLRELPLWQRRERLLEILPRKSRWIAESLVQIGSGRHLYDLMVENDLEGIVAKRLQDPYTTRTKWYKFKNKRYSQEIGRERFFRKRDRR